MLVVKLTSPRPSIRQVQVFNIRPLSGSWNNLTKCLGFQTRNIGRVGYLQRLDTMKKYQASIKNYYRLISEVDAASKTIVDELDRQGLFNSTMIIVTADNGFMLGEHGMSGKWFPFEENTRVPLIIYDPRIPEKKAGRRDDSFTLNVDFLLSVGRRHQGINLRAYSWGSRSFKDSGRQLS
jgi:membrane-anchored protein YejM (alkaline phosphatase superfamily)